MEASPTFNNIPEDKKLRVLGQARREFAAQGFAGASMNRLAAALGIAKGSIFKYFGTKEGLFAKVFEAAVEQFSGQLKEAREETSGRPLEARLERLLVVGTDFVRAHPDVYRMYLKMLAGGGFPMRESLLARVRSLSARFLAPMVEEAKASGELPASLDARLAVFLLDAVLDRFVQAQVEPWMDTGLHLRLEDGDNARQAAKRLAAMLSGGLRVG
jgi:AcrR family transcriptional regulator